MNEAIDYGEVLNRIERSEKRYRLVFLSAAAFEALFLIVMLLLLDPGNRTQLMILIAAVGSYTTVVLAIVALGAYVNRGHQRLLQALQVSSKPPSSST